MFSIRTTWGTITILIADALICYFIFWFFLLIIPGVPESIALENFLSHFLVLAFIAIILFSLGLKHCYSFMVYTARVDLIYGIIPAFLFSCGAIAFLAFLIEDVWMINWRIFPPLIIIYVCLFLFRHYVFYSMPKNRERILILGATNQAKQVIEETIKKKYKGYDIVGVATLPESNVGKDFNGVTIIAQIPKIEEAVREHAIDGIVVTMRERRGNMPVDDLVRLKVANIRVQEGTNFYEKIKRKIFVDEFLKPSWIIFEAGFFHTSIHGAVKRAQGILVSFILLAIFSPLLLLTAITIRIESEGPVFYRQKRVGLNGRVFKLLKFRSMQKNAESNGEPVFAQKNDPRITRVGHFIRKTRLDEMPQLINIFKGDMDLVGPRPERPYFVEQLREQIPYYNLRNSVRPGLTGWAQVNYHYGDSLKDAKEKLRFDLFYIKHFSWSFDLLIILFTIRTVLTGKGR
ncbi:TIGR03013 family XrtA/PEP-CTERM system glycosyltransferase [Thermodesulfobacteriota bacterium]